jgi:branched-chain amino acid transport system ATP-binding protein
MSDAMLQVEGLEVLYKRAIRGIADVSLAVPRGSIVAVLGANGAGKTTTLRAISGFIGLDEARVSRGRILFEGEAIENRAPHVVAGRGLMLVPERDKVFPNLTVAENLDVVVSRATPAERRRREALVFDAFPRLGRLRSREAGLVSGGERQMLAIGAALVSAPTLLLIDELSLGLAPVVVEEITARLAAIRGELALTILLVEQSAATALALADHAYVMENGRVVLSGSAAELANDPSVQHAYLGTGAGGQRSYRDIARERLEKHRG